MKLWLLQAKEKYRQKYFGYDCMEAIVIRASSPREARKITQANGGEEIEPMHVNAKGFPAWSNPEYSTCQELRAEDAPGVVLSHFHYA